MEPSDILRKVLDAEEDGDDDKVEGLLCGAVKHLRANRSKPDQTVFLTLMYLAKTRPTVLQSETVIEVSYCHHGKITVNNKLDEKKRNLPHSNLSKR